MVYSASNYEIVDQVVLALQEFTTFVTYDVRMETDDPAGTIATVDPPMYLNVPARNEISFTITLEPVSGGGPSMFSDSVYTVPTTLRGDDDVILAEWDLVFVVSSTP